MQMTRAIAALCGIAAIAALSACTVGQEPSGNASDMQTSGQVIGQLTGGQVCVVNECSDSAGEALYSGRGLKSGPRSLTFEMVGPNQRPSQFRLLGEVEPIVRPGREGRTHFSLVDGTLAGQVTDQPVRVTFVLSHNSKAKAAAYCDFSTGRFEAVNYIINTFEITGGEATCFDRGGAERKVTSSTFTVE